MRPCGPCVRQEDRFFFHPEVIFFFSMHKGHQSTSAKCQPVRVAIRAVGVFPFPVGVLVKGCRVILVKGTQSKQLHEAFPSGTKNLFPWQHYDPSDRTVPFQPGRQRHDDVR